MKLATILCGQCATENRHAERLGTLEKENGRLCWAALDVEGARRLRKAGDLNWPGAQYWREWIDLNTAEETLPAWCKRHGACGVSTVDVLAARGTVTVTIKAAPEERTGY